MGIFKKKKNLQPTPIVQEIPDNIKVCELFKGEKNKYGTFVLTPFWLCKKDDLYTIDNEGSEFSILRINWKGKKTTSSIVSTTNGSSIGKNKKTGRLMGATVGTMIAPGIGTIIGAAHGSGNAKVKEESTSTTVTKNIVKEEVSDIELDIQYKNGETKTLNFKCYEKQANILLNLFSDQKNIENITNPYEEIKMLKELLDIGAITEDEFNIKKKQLLDL